MEGNALLVALGKIETEDYGDIWSIVKTAVLLARIITMKGKILATLAGRK